MPHRPPASWAITIRQGFGDKVIAALAKHPIELVLRLDNVSRLLEQDVYLLWSNTDIRESDFYSESDVIRVEGGLLFAYNLMRPLDPRQLAGFLVQRVPLRLLQQFQATPARELFDPGAASAS